MLFDWVVTPLAFDGSSKKHWALHTNMRFSGRLGSSCPYWALVEWEKHKPSVVTLKQCQHRGARGTEETQTGSHRESILSSAKNHLVNVYSLQAEANTEMILQCVKQKVSWAPKHTKNSWELWQRTTHCQVQIYFHSEMVSRKQIETLSWPFLRFLYMLIGFVFI